MVILGSLVDNVLGTELYSVDLRYGVLGLAFAIGGGAELLPAGRIRLATAFRILSIVCFVVFFILIVFGSSVVF